MLQDGFDQAMRDTYENESIKSESDMPSELGLFTDFYSDNTAASGSLVLSQQTFNKLVQVKGRNYDTSSRMTGYSTNLENMVEAQGKMMQAKRDHK